MKLIRYKQGFACEEEGVIYPIFYGKDARKKAILKIKELRDEPTLEDKVKLLEEELKNIKQSKLK